MPSTVRDLILSWYRKGLAAVDPFRVTQQALSDLDAGQGKIVVLAVGKAAVAMAQAADDVLGDRIHAGLIVTKQGQIAEDLDRFVEIEAGHPMPNMESLRAGETALEMVSDLGADDTVIALVSGGGSALLEAPIDGISLSDMQITTELLMYAGAGIHELNATRKALSAIKGGGLRRAIGDARCVTLLLSDVVGNDPTIIASGPTIPAPTNRLQAWQVIVDFHLQDQVPTSVRQSLTSDAPTADVVDSQRDLCQIIADNDLFVSTVIEAARNDGFNVAAMMRGWRDDARELGRRIVTESRQSAVDVLIGGGEATSIVRGQGRGGRNTETALVAAMELASTDDWTIASLASDGDDGNSGAAGAIVQSASVTDQSVAREALSTSDSAGYLDQHEALVVTGLSGTNVNDVYIAVRNSACTGVSK